MLLGDAAHTAHFSIGSGTKLAMEDSIALGGARCARRRGTWKRAFVDYELEREPFVERTQDAASESAAYFGRIASYSHLEPIQFAFNLLTRAGRITHATLGVRDPQFTRVLDGWMGGRAVSPPPAFSAFELRGVRLENRFELVESTVAVSPEGRVSAEEAVVPEGRRLLRLSHAGRRGATQPRSRGVDLPLADGWPVVAPTKRPYGPFGAIPGEPDEDAVLAAFVAAAKAAQADVLEIDMAHGYLLGSYLSPLTNDERRPASLPRQRARGGAGGVGRPTGRAPLGDRLAPAREQLEDGIEIARALAEHGCDLIHVVAGQTIHDDRPQYRRGFLTPLSDRVRNGARVPTLVGGYLTTLDEANTIVGAGRADLVLLDLPDTQLERTLEASSTVRFGEVRA